MYTPLDEQMILYLEVDEQMIQHTFGWTNDPVLRSHESEC